MLLRGQQVARKLPNMPVLPPIINLEQVWHRHGSV
jgi:hypothetical protein